MYDRKLEIREAIDAGERALHSLRHAEKSLDSARNWGLIDIFGGKTISGLVKHVRISDAKSSINQAKYDLDRFSRELSDVRDLQGLNVDISDFLTFADFFFDGLIADILVQSKIKQARRNIVEAISRVENILILLRKQMD